MDALRVSEFIFRLNVEICAAFIVAHHKNTFFARLKPIENAIAIHAHVTKDVTFIGSDQFDGITWPDVKIQSFFRVFIAEE